MGLSFVLGMGLGASFDKTIKQAGTRVKQLGKEITAVEKSGDFKLGKGLETLIEKTRESNREFKEAQKRLNDLNAEAKTSGKVSKNLARRIDQAERKVKSISASTNRYRGRLRDQVIAAQDAGHSVKGLRQEYSKLGATVDTLNRKQNRRMVMHQAGTGMRAGFDRVNPYVLGAAIAIPAKAAIDFEDAFAGFEKVAKGTDAQIKAMAPGFLDLGGEIAMTNKEFVDIGTAAAQAEIPMDKILGFTRDAGQMGVAFDMTGAKSGKMMTAWRNGMGLTQERVVGLGDAVNHLSNNMASEADALGELIQRQGAVGKGAGFNEIQIAAVGSALLSTGNTVEIASTGFKNLSNRLTMGAAATKEQQKAFNELGMDAEDVAARMQEDAPTAVLSVIEAIKQMPKEMRSGIMVKLFGSESLGAIQPLIENTDLLRKALSLVADKTKYSGSMLEEFEKKSKTTKAQLQLTANAADKASISLGGSLLPVIKEIAGEMTPMISSFADWAKGNKGVVKGVAALGAGLIGLKLGMVVLSPLGRIYKLVKRLRGGGKAGGGGALGGAVPVEVVNGGLGGGLDGVGGGGKSRGKARGKLGRFGRMGQSLKRSGIGRMAGKLGRGLGKGFKPLGIALSAGTLLSGIMSGDAHAMGSSIGDIGGGLGGAAAGAAIGTMVFPGIGTAIGGIIGGMGGGMLGEWLGDKVGGMFSSKPDTEFAQPGGDIKIDVPVDVKVPEGISPDRAAGLGKRIEEAIRRVIPEIIEEERRLALN